MWAGRTLVAGVAALLALLFVIPSAGADLERLAGSDCDADPTNPAPSSAEWQRRDMENQACAYGRTEDQLLNPAFLEAFARHTPSTYADGILRQASDPFIYTITGSRIVPGATTGDPFRQPQDWVQAGRGRTQRVTYPSSYSGARQVGEIFYPPASVAGPYPGVVVAPGGNQAYRQLYHWAAQGLAEEGYMVMLYDAPGQGESETFRIDGLEWPIPPNCYPDTQFHCFYRHALRDAIDFFLSPASPLLGMLDSSRIGLAGQGLGAVAAFHEGHDDTRIKTAVTWGSQGFLPPDISPRIPTLSFWKDHGGETPSAYRTPPGATAFLNTYNQLKGAGIDTMHLHLRASTDNEWSYLPIRYASRYGERVSFHYTLAWLDAYLRGDPTGFTRLTAPAFDGSADRSSIGAGKVRIEEGRAVNEPYLIQGQTRKQRLSFYFRSRYWLKGGTLLCEDMQADRKFEGADGFACDRG